MTKKEKLQQYIEQARKAVTIAKDVLVLLKTLKDLFFF